MDSSDPPILVANYGDMVPKSLSSFNHHPIHAKYLKQKLGRVIIGKLVEGIFRATKIERIVCEPQADNWPAIISLKRAKFRDHGRVRRANLSLVRLSLPRNLVEKKLK